MLKGISNQSREAWQQFSQGRRPWNTAPTLRRKRLTEFRTGCCSDVVAGAAAWSPRMAESPVVDGDEEATPLLWMPAVTVVTPALDCVSLPTNAAASDKVWRLNVELPLVLVAGAVWLEDDVAGSGVSSNVSLRADGRPGNETNVEHRENTVLEAANQVHPILQNCSWNEWQEATQEQEMKCFMASNYYWSKITETDQTWSFVSLWHTTVQQENRSVCVDQGSSDSVHSHQACTYAGKCEGASPWWTEVAAAAVAMVVAVAAADQ